MFWESFYQKCKAAGTTPNAVCKEIGLSNAIATHWKNGTLPKADVLVNIADVLGCSVDSLLGRTAPLQAMPEDNWRVLLSQLSDESRADLEKYLDFLLWKQGQESEASK